MEQTIGESGMDMIESLKEYLNGRVSDATIRDYVNALSRLGDCQCDAKCLTLNILKIRKTTQYKAMSHYLEMCFKLGMLRVEEYMRLRLLLKDQRKKLQRSYSPPSTISLDTTRLSTLSQGLKEWALALLYSGARLSELYYIRENMNRLELYIFNEFGYLELAWSRGKKRVYAVFMPLDIWSGFLKAPMWTRNHLSRRMKKELGVTPKSLRKYFYQRCVRTIDREICDFYQGRLSVSTANYLDTFRRARELYPVVAEALLTPDDEALDRIMKIRLFMSRFIL